jgi:tRNA modification GTPase
VCALRSVRERGLGVTAPLVLVRTKSDLSPPHPPDLSALGAELGVAAQVEVSAETGAGVQQLLKTVADVMTHEVGGLDLDAPVLTQLRHRHAIDAALREVMQFRRTWAEEALPATIAAVHLHTAADALQELIGGIDTEQVLDEVFRRFCVGK